MISTTPNGEKATKLSKMVENGQLRVIVDEVVDFDDVLQVSLECIICLKGLNTYYDGQAYDRMLNRNAKGKIIVKVQDV